MSILAQALFASYKTAESVVAPAMSFVSSTINKVAISTTISENIPSVLTGDGLFAFFMCRSLPIIPSGWTEINTAICSHSGIDQRLILIRKNSVLSSDTGTVVQFNQQLDGRLNLALISIRSSTGSFNVETPSSLVVNTAPNVIATPVSITSTSSNEIFIIGGTTVIGQPSPISPPSTLSGFTLTSGKPEANRLNCQYRVVPAAFTNSGSYNMDPDGVVGETSFATTIFRVRPL